jgi:D-beta-D-heptose 7-phosphate kinase / D-beta-D-heptose 1-phosphate adenosyltransferase
MTDRAAHRDTVDRWCGRRVVVLGGVLLDEWHFTEPDRLCREAPAPLVTLRRRQDCPGGAGNAAVNLAALGAYPVLVAAVGDDPAGERLREALRAAGVADATVTVPSYRTRTRRRIVAGDQILLCEQEGAASGPPAAGAVDALLDQLAAVAGGAPLLVSDYGLSRTDGRIAGWLAAHRDDFGLLVLDSDDPRRWPGVRPSVVTPSWAELRAVLPGPDGDGDRPAAAVRDGAELLRRTGARVAAVTLDVAGSVVVDADGAAHRTTARPAPASHTVGAGDAYVAVLTLALDVGAPVAVAADLAQCAASATVASLGTCVCSRDELAAAVPGRRRSAEVSAAELVELVRGHRDQGRTVVFTNGCFDVLHRGHVGYLAEAKQLGDVLVVAVNSDASVRRLKGPQRPVNQAADRVALLGALACVDHVVVFEEDSPAGLIEAIRPDVYVKGGDYPPELVPEAPLVRSLGGEVRTLGYVPDRSTSAIIDRIRSRAAAPRSPADDTVR